MIRPSCHKNGFTLVEILVVVALLAMVCSLAAMGIRYPLAAAERETFGERLRWLDATARTRSRRGDRCKLVINDKNIELRCRRKPESTQFIAIPDGKNRSLIRFIGGETTGDGTREVAVDSFGLSQSYAYSFRVKEDATWTLCLGCGGTFYSGLSLEETQVLLASEAGVWEGSAE